MIGRGGRSQRRRIFGDRLGDVSGATGGAVPQLDKLRSELIEFLWRHRSLLRKDWLCQIALALGLSGGSRSRRLPRNPAALLVALMGQPRAGGFSPNLAPLLGCSLSRLFLRLTRKRPRRRRFTPLARQRLADRFGTLRVHLPVLAALPFSIITPCRF